MKALAALGADVNLCTTCTKNARELSIARAVPQIEPSTFQEHHLPTEIYMESQYDDWAIYDYVDGGETSDAAVPNDYSPVVVRDTKMRTLLEEVGAMTPHTKETHQHKVPTPQCLRAGQQRRGARVLCLDGGGARGLIQLEVLRQIEERLCGKIIDKFDYIVGTSAGGIIALALVYGKYMHLYLHAYRLAVLGGGWLTGLEPPFPLVLNLIYIVQNRKYI